MAVLFAAPMAEGTCSPASTCRWPEGQGSRFLPLAGLLPHAAARLDARGGFMDRVRSLLGGCPVTHGRDLGKGGNHARLVHTV
jgi:hypothetical protein